MEHFPVWNKLPPMSSSGLSDDILWRNLLSSGTGGTPAQRAGQCFQEPKWVHINHAGVPATIEIDRSYLIRALRLRYRDLAAIDPTLPLPAPSVILVRARAIAINLDVGGAIRIIICENQVYVLSVPKASDPAVTSLPTENHPFVKWMCRCLRGGSTPSSANSMHNGIHETESSDIFEAFGGNTPPNSESADIMNADINNNSQNVAGSGRDDIYTVEVKPRRSRRHHHTNPSFDLDMPYELRALEVALTAALGILTAEVDELEKWGYPAVDCLLKSVDRETLEKVRKLKNWIDKLQEKVQRLVTEIGDLMKDDDDMADLYLARRAEAQGLLPLPQPGEARDHIDDQIERAAKKARHNSTVVFDDERGVDVDLDGDQRGIEHADVYEEEEAKDAKEKRAGEAFEDRQRARHEGRSRSRNNSKNHRRRGEERMEQRNRGQSRQGGGNGGSRGHHRNFEDHIDETYSTSDSLDSVDLEDEALSQAEEDFLLDQRTLDNGREEDFLRDQKSFDNGGTGTFFGASRFGRVDPHDIEEAEDLLETMFERSDMLLRRLSLLDEQCDDTEELLDLDLDQKRNELVGLNVVVSAMSMSFGFAAAIGGIFGMNLKNSELEEEAWVLVLVLVVMLSGSVVLLLIVLLYMKVKKLMFIPTTV